MISKHLENQGENKFFDILNSLPDLIFLQDKEGKYLEVYSSELNLLPVNALKFIGKKANNIFPEQFVAKAEELRLAAISENKYHTLEFSTRKDEKKCFYEVRFIPFSGSKTLTVFRDITGSKKLELNLAKLENKYKELTLENETLKEQQKLKLSQERKVSRIVEERSENLEHNMRSFLNSVLGLADMFRGEAEFVENQSFFLFAENIRQHGQKLLSLIELGLESDKTAQKIHLDIQPLSAGSVIKNVIERLSPEADKKNIKLNFIDRTRYSVLADEKKLGEILSNLVENAIEYSGTDSIFIESTYDMNKELIVIKVKDTGTGIPKDLLIQIFNPFRPEKRTTGYNVAGLGLPIVKRLVEMMKGQIDIQSEADKGTTVTITLPASESEVDSLTAKDSFYFGSSPELLYLGKRKPFLLIVEDDSSSRKMLEITLGKISKVNLASTGDEALNLIDYKLQNGQVYDLVLLDIGLPVPWDGIHLRKEIISRYPAYDTIPFIAQTAFTMNGDRSNILKTGFNGYLAKPIDRRDLIKTIAKHLQEAEK